VTVAMGVPFPISAPGLSGLGLLPTAISRLSRDSQSPSRIRVQPR
jgi:hypothetical protein